MIDRIIKYINKKQFERYLREAEMRQRIAQNIENKNK